MGKRRRGKKGIFSVEATFELPPPSLEIEFTSRLLSLAFHPEKPIFASGLSNGKIFLNTYDDEILQDLQIDQILRNKKAIKSGVSVEDKKDVSWYVYNPEIEYIDDEEGSSPIVTTWKKRRHKGSVWDVIFDATGKTMYSTGLDKVINKIDSETGKIISKKEKATKSKFTKLAVSTTHPILVGGTESSSVKIFDTRTMEQTHTYSKVHSDLVSSIVAMPHINQYHYLTVGSTTLAEIDIRKGILYNSDHQDDDLLSFCFPDPVEGKLGVAGTSSGIVTTWNPSINNWADQITRINLSEDSIDCVLSTLDIDEDNDDTIFASGADGIIRKVDIKSGRVLEQRVHSKVDDVLFLDIDYQYKLVSGGADGIKLWNMKDIGETQWKEDDEDLELSKDSSSDADDSELDSDSDEQVSRNRKKLKHDEDDNSDEDEDEDEDEDDSSPIPEIKLPVPKKNEPDDSDSEAELHNKKKTKKSVKKSKKKFQTSISTKQVRSQKQVHGIAKFDGL